MLVVAIGLLCWLLLQMFVLCGLVVGLELFDSVFVYLCSGAIWLWGGCVFVIISWRFIVVFLGGSWLDLRWFCLRVGCGAVCLRFLVEFVWF